MGNRGNERCLQSVSLTAMKPSQSHSQRVEAQQSRGIAVQARGKRQLGPLELEDERLQGCWQGLHQCLHARCFKRAKSIHVL